MRSRKEKIGGIGLFLGLVLMYAGVFAARAWWLRWARAIHLEASKSVYFHDDIVELRLWSRDPALEELWKSEPPAAQVVREGRAVTTIAGLRDVRLAYDAASGEWVGRWPCPWNADAGEYALALSSAPRGLSQRVQSEPFKIARRRPSPLPPGFSVVTLESSMPIESMVVVSPTGEKKDWTGLLDWVQFAGADAFWMLGGQTPGPDGQTWVTVNREVIPRIASECRRRGIKFGVYAMCYLTMSKEPLPRYEYALDVKDGHTLPTRAISLNDARRPDDVAALLKSYADLPGVDYVGLDYIRNALGGYELAEDFFKEMPGVTPPPEWRRLTQEERRVWFARKKIMRKDQAFIDAWQWWRAHRVASVVRRIKARIGNKPLWAFTLTWDRGWHHGQDAVMMNDAGVDADSLMLYEADKEQFGAIMHDWHDYVRRGDVQLVVGDVIDWPLHQKSADGPKELGRRMKRAIDEIYADGPAAGVFFHDLGRALYGGRLGRWGTRGWMEQVRDTIRYFRAASGAHR